MAGRPTYVRLALLGVLLFLATAVVILTAVIFDTSILGFVPFIVVPALIVGAAIYFWKPWGLVVGVLGGLIGLLAFGFDAPGNLAEVDSFYDSVVTLMLMVSVIFILVGSVGGLVQHFQHKESTEVSPLQRQAIMGVFGLIAVFAVISLVLTVTGRDSVSAQDAAGATVLTAKNAKFDLDEIRVVSSGTTKVLVKNKDPYVHTFTVEDLGIDVKLGPGDEKLVAITSPSAGTHYFLCTVTGHEESMHGDIVAQ